MVLKQCWNAMGMDRQERVTASVVRSFREDLKNVADEFTTPPKPGDGRRA